MPEILREGSGLSVGQMFVLDVLLLSLFSKDMQSTMHNMMEVFFKNNGGPNNVYTCK
jgi:hypothetical protein